MKKYAAIYARKSKDKNDSFSIAFQTQRCINYCNEHNWEYKIFDIDEGFSAGNTKRPGFQQMLREIEIGGIDKIIIYKYDRISRSTKDFINLADNLQKKGVGIISLVEQFDTTTAFGRAMVMQLMIWAQLEREQTSERIKDNAIDRVSLGRWYGGNIPFGYNKEKIIDKNNKIHPKLIINNEEANIIKFIYENYLKPGGSTRKIAKLLNDNKVLYKNEPKIWSSYNISHILKLYAYCQNSASVYEYFKNNTDIQIINQIEDFDSTKSIMIFGGTKRYLDGSRSKTKSKDRKLLVAEHEYIIDSITWLKAQKKLLESVITKNPNAGHGKASILSGLVFCECGSLMTIVGSKKEDVNGESYRYFQCTKKDRKEICNSKNIRIHVLENHVEQEIFKYINNTNVLKKYIKIKDKLRNSKQDLIEKQKNLNNDILILDNKISNLLNSFSDNLNLKEYVEKEINRLDLDKRKLKEFSEQIESQLMDITNEDLSIELLKNKIRDFETIYINANFKEKQIIIKTIIKKINIKPKVTIDFFDLSFSILKNIDREASSNFLSFGSGFRQKISWKMYIANNRSTITCSKQIILSSFSKSIIFSIISCPSPKIIFIFKSLLIMP